MSGGRAGRLRVRRPSLGEPVLERVVAALAARADLPIDRLADAQLVASALAVGASLHSPDGDLCVGLDVEGGSLGLTVGPLNRGAGERVIADSRLPGVGVVLDRLVDGWRVEDDDASETLLLTIGAGGTANS
jgi:serine/threonine-protein kinase RsbW